MKSIPLVLSLFLATSALAYTEFAPAARTGPAAFTQTDAAVAAHGNDYLAAWTSDAPYPFGTSVWCALVHPDGTLAAGTATPLDPGNNTARGVSLSEGRDGYFAAWYSDGQLNAAVIDSFGRVERRTRLPFPQSNFAVTHTAWNGAVHIIVTQVASALTATLIDDNGEQISGPVNIGSPQARIDVIADASGFLVLSSHPQGGTDAIYGRRISSIGVAGEWFLIRTVASTIDGLAAMVDGTRDVIAWGDQFGVWIMELNGASAQLTSTRASVTDVIAVNGRIWIAYQEEPSSRYLTIGADQSVTSPVTLPLLGPAQFASNGATLLAAGYRVNAVLDVYGTFLTPASAAAPFLISRSKADQANGSIVRDLLVWDEQVGDNRQIFIGGFDAAGRQLSADGNNTNPVAAFNGTDYLVVWLSQRGSGDVEIVARRVSASGAIIDSADIDVGPGTQYGGPAVASDGVNWLVAALRDRVSQGFCFSDVSRVTLNRVTADGVVLDGGGVVMPAREGLPHYQIDIGWTGTRYLVFWSTLCQAFHVPTTTSLDAAFVSRDLSTVDDFAVEPVTRAGSYSSPRVAAGEPSLLAWSFLGSTQYQIVNGPLLARRRASGAVSRIAGIGAAVVDASRSDDGTFSIFTQSGSALFETIVAADGERTEPRFLYQFMDGEQTNGNVDARRIVVTLLNSPLDPAAGARRLWYREVPSAR